MKKRLYTGVVIDKQEYAVVLGHDGLKAAISDIGQDSDAQLFPARALEYVKNKIYDVEYPMTRARELIPASEAKGDWIKSVTFREYDKVGFAKVIANMADDLPIVNIRGKEFTVKVKKIGAAYAYTVDDIAEAAHANVPLLTKDSEAVVEVIEQAIERKAWYGDTKSNIPGLLYNPNVTAATVATGVGGYLWSQKTNDEIILDMTHAISDPEDLTNGVESGLDTLCLPIARYNLIRTRRMAAGTDTTILQFFLNNNPGVEVEKLIWLKNMPTVPSTGATSGTINCMLAYKRDPSKLCLEIPMEMKQLPPQERNFAFIVNCKLHFAGVSVMRPLSVNIVEGI